MRLLLDSNITPPSLAPSSMLFPPPQILDVHSPFQHSLLPSYGVLMEWIELALMENVVM